MDKDDNKSHSSRAEFESQRHSRQEPPTSLSMPMKNSSIIAAGMIPETITIQNPVERTNLLLFEKDIPATQDSMPQKLHITVPKMEEIKLNIDA